MTYSRFGPENCIEMGAKIAPFLSPFRSRFWPLFWTPSKSPFCPNRPAERSPRDRKGEKVIPKWSQHGSQTLRCSSIFALLEPPGGPEASRNTQDLIFFASGSMFAPQASVLSVFGSHFWPARAQAPPRTAKNRQEPAKNLPKHKTHNDTPHQILLIEEPRQPPRNAEPEFGGRRCARRMASSIRSGPGGARGVFAFRSCSFPYLFCLKKSSLVFSLKNGCLIVCFTCIFIKSKVA